MRTASNNAASRTQIETRSIDFVPENERHGKIADQGRLWFLSNFHFMSIAVGFVGPSLGLSLCGTVLASVLGILIGTTFQAFHASQGPELGLPQMIQSRAQFGFRGVIVPLLAALLSPLSFNIVATVLIAEGAAKLWGLDRAMVAIAVAVASGTLAIFGHDWIHRAFRVLFWISLPLFAVLSFALVGRHTGGATGGTHVAGSWIWAAFFTQLSTTASFNIGLAPYVSDYSRYLPKRTPRWQIIGQVFAGSAISAIWLISLGAWLATRFGASDGLLALHQAGDAVIPGLGLLGVILSICALVATVGMNSYSGMLMLITAVDCLRRVQPSRALRVTALVGWTLVWGGFAANLNGNAIGYVNAAMVILLYALIPWTAVNLCDFFILRRGEYVIADLFTPQGVYGAWSARGLTAYAVGFAASIPFFVVPDLYTGPLAACIGGVDVGWLVGLTTAAAAYLLPGWCLTASNSHRPEPSTACT
jgi:purine-cytosine permease-like protein